LYNFEKDAQLIEGVVHNIYLCIVYLYYIISYANNVPNLQKISIP
jgi:hypothetical protein